MSSPDRPRILLVDDDRDFQRLIGGLLGEFADVQSVSTVASARHALGKEPDVILLDLQLDGSVGDPLVAEAAEVTPRSTLFVLSGAQDLSRGMTLLREGAEDYFKKPIDPLELRRRVLEALVRRRKGHVLGAHDGSRDNPALATLALGVSEPMRELCAQIRTFAGANMPVLIVGETGSGKELVARAVHGASPRASGPFVTVNCGALPRELVESELFGHTAGAFTGAGGARRGLVGAADGGTLFLDEIGELPLELQPKLLRFLQEGEVRPVGSDKTLSANVRVIAATHQDLEARVASKEFREDLFFRLRVLPLQVPALRDRSSDIPGLAEYFLAQACAEAGKSLHGFDKAALRALMSRPWPGNVRELENCVLRAVVSAAGPRVSLGDLTVGGPAEAEDLRWPESYLHRPFSEARAEVVEKFERAYVAQALDDAGGNVSEAARRAGLPRKSLWRIAQRVGLAADQASRKRGKLSSGDRAAAEATDVKRLVADQRRGYVERTREALGEAEAVLRGSMGLAEWANIKAMAQRVAGSGGSFGLPEVSGLGQELASAADRLDAASCLEHLGALRGALEAPTDPRMRVE